MSDPVSPVDTSDAEPTDSSNNDPSDALTIGEKRRSARALIAKYRRMLNTSDSCAAQSQADLDKHFEAQDAAHTNIETVIENLRSFLDELAFASSANDATNAEVSRGSGSRRTRGARRATRRVSARAALEDEEPDLSALRDRDTRRRSITRSRATRLSGAHPQAEVPDSGQPDLRDSSRSRESGRRDDGGADDMDDGVLGDAPGDENVHPVESGTPRPVDAAPPPVNVPEQPDFGDHDGGDDMDDGFPGTQDDEIAHPVEAGAPRSVNARQDDAMLPVQVAAHVPVQHGSNSGMGPSVGPAGAFTPIGEPGRIDSPARTDDAQVVRNATPVSRRRHREDTDDAEWPVASSSRSRRRVEDLAPGRRPPDNDVSLSAPGPVAQADTRSTGEAQAPEITQRRIAGTELVARAPVVADEIEAFITDENLLGRMRAAVDAVLDNPELDLPAVFEFIAVLESVLNSVDGANTYAFTLHTEFRYKDFLLKERMRLRIIFRLRGFRQALQTSIGLIGVPKLGVSRLAEAIEGILKTS